MKQVNKCIFYADTAGRYGGAIAGGGYPVLNSRIEGNKARRGGGIYSLDSFTLANCVVVKNVADSMGGGMYNSRPPRVTSSTFANNRAYVSAGAIYNTNFGAYNDSTFTNCIVWGNNSGVFNQNTTNSVFSYSLVQGLGAFPAKRLLAGTTNPQFADTLSGNYELLATSPCIDTGKNNVMPLGITTDYLGYARIADGIIDLGAYEWGSNPLSLALVRFNGYHHGDPNVVLEWQFKADGEYMFTLQKSNDGLAFSDIDNGITKNGTQHFRYGDELTAGKNYYRLMYKDRAGQVAYSKTLVFTSKQNTQTVKLYPNPATDEIYFEADDDEMLGSAITIYDGVGRFIQSTTITERKQRISLTDLSHGLYFVKTQSGVSMEFYRK